MLQLGGKGDRQRLEEVDDKQVHFVFHVFTLLDVVQLLQQILSYYLRRLVALDAQLKFRL